MEIQDEKDMLETAKRHSDEIQAHKMEVFKDFAGVDEVDVKAEPED